MPTAAVIQPGLFGTGPDLPEGFRYTPDLISQAEEQALHAWLLAIEHPRTGEILHWEAALPEDLLLLKRLLAAAE